MKLIKCAFIFLFFQIKFNEAKTIFLNIRIYSTVQISEANFRVFSGKYGIFDEKNDKILEIYKNSEVLIRLADNNTIQLWRDGKKIYQGKKVTFRGIGFVNTFEIIPEKPSYEKRLYDDNLTVKTTDKSLLFLNNVELEKYVAGVIESEAGGHSKDMDFFLLHSIISRTYALANIRKHASEGFHLCDDMHCQVYKNRSSLSYIFQSAMQTAGQVIIDENRKMISAAYHSNSGGQTMNSEDVWSFAVHYLRSIIDTFSLAGKNAKWEHKIPLKQWLEFLSSRYNYPIEDSSWRAKALNFKQPERLIYFPYDIPLKNIRKDLNLRSTWFEIINNGDTVYFFGKGYGHGIGLSQEGALRMIELGYTYEQIIKFYYQNVKIVNFDELEYFFINFKY